MKFQLLSLLLLLSCMNMSEAQSFFGNCCLGFVPKMRRNAHKFIETYRLQETDGDCNISAVVFLMKRPQKKTQTVCANPKDKIVQHLVKKVDQRKRNELTRRIVGGENKGDDPTPRIGIVYHPEPAGLDYTLVNVEPLLSSCYDEPLDGSSEM